MRPYIISTIRNKANVNATVSFELYDLESGDTIRADHSEMRKAITNGFKVYNAELSGASPGELQWIGKMKGLYCDLYDLPYRHIDEHIHDDGGLFILLNIADQKFVALKYVGDEPRLAILNRNELHVCKTHGIVNNLDKDFDIVCDKVENDIKIKTADISVQDLIVSCKKNDKKDKSNKQKNSVHDTQDIDFQKHKIQEQIDSIGNRKEQLLKEAYDKDIVWDMKTFIEFMDLNSWTFSSIKHEYITGCEYTINSISPDCPVIHLPKECRSSNLLIDGTPTNLDTLIIGPNMYWMESLFRFEDRRGNSSVIEDFLKGDGYNFAIDKLMDKIEGTSKLKINNIYFQPGKTISKENCDFRGLSSLIVTEHAGLPHFPEIENIYINCDIYNIGDIKSEIRHSEKLIGYRKIKCCFQNTNINKDEIKIDAKDIYDSFNGFNSTVNNLKIKFTNKLVTLNYSLSWSNVDAIDISECDKLNDLRYSFRNLPIKELDLSKSALINLYGAVSDCKQLFDIKLPPRLMRLSSQTFLDCDNIKKLELPPSIELVGYPIMAEGTELIFPENIDYIDSMLFHGNNAKRLKLTFKGEVKSIKGKIMSLTGNINRLSFPDTIQSVGAKVFSGSLIEVYDSEVMPMLNYVSEEMFEDCGNLKHVILRDNVIKIGKNAFKDCINLQTIVLSDSVEDLSSAYFSNIKSSEIVKVYVVDKSVAHKKLVGNKKITLIVVDSLEEALFKVFGESKTSEIKQYKFDLMLSGTEYEPLLKEPFRKDISFTYKMLLELKENSPESTKKLELNTSKLRFLAFDKFDAVKQGIKSRVELYSRYIDNCEDIGTYTNGFISICNFITSLVDNCDMCYTDDFIESVSKVGNLMLDKILWQDMHSMICVANFNVVQKAQILIISKYDDVYHASDGQIMFMVPFATDGIYSFVTTTELDLLVGQSNPKYYKYVGIGKYLQPGDNLSTYIKISNADIPTAFWYDILDNVRATMKLIGVQGGKEVLARVAKGKLQSRFFNVLLLDIANQIIFEAKCQFNVSGDDKLDKISYIQIVNRVELNQMNTLDKSYFNDLAIGLLNRRNKSVVEITSMSKSRIDEGFSNMSNYDLDGDMNICYLAELIYQHNIQDIQSLINNVALLKRVFNTHLYGDAPVSLKDIKTKDKIYRKDIVTQINGGKEFLMQFIAGEIMYITGVLTGTTSMSSKKVFKFSYMSLQKVISLLYNIGYSRSNDIYKSTCRVDNDRIDVDAFFFTLTLTTSMTNRDGIKLHLAIDKGNADAYIVGEVWDTDYYKLFRCKSYFSAMSIVLKMQENENLLNGFRALTHGINTGDIAGTRNKIAGQLAELRDYIMNGAHNSYPYIGPCAELYDRLAKQPKNI